MATPTQVANGTQNGATVGSTTHTLTTQTTAAMYAILIDLSNMVNGDEVLIQILVKTLTGSTARVIFSQTYTNVQADPVIMTPPFLTVHSWAATLKQVAGTARDFDWSAIKV